MPALGVVAALLLTVVPLGRPAAADQLSQAKAKAAQIEQEIQSTGQQIDALDQQYQAAEAHKAALEQQIATTQARIARTQAKMATDRAHLRKAAVRAYVTDGLVASENSLFAGNQASAQDARIYNQVLTGNLGSALADLHTAGAQLTVQQHSLRSQDTQAVQAVTAAQDAYHQAQALESQQQQTLQQVNGQIATLIAQQQAAAEAAAKAAAQARLAAAQARSRAQVHVASQPVGQGAAPPPAPGNAGTIAVRAAETQVGVPYVWGGETPGVGFDCSGLTAWAWGQAGVSLPHYSGAQMADSTPVPVADLRPGDLLFYGPGGSQHVAMYVGGGQMIEAPYTGATVRITAARLGAGFAGAGRP